jgi:hypothetical protein
MLPTVIVSIMREKPFSSDNPVLSNRSPLATNDRLCNAIVDLLLLFVWGINEKAEALRHPKMLTSHRHRLKLVPSDKTSLWVHQARFLKIRPVRCAVAFISTKKFRDTCVGTNSVVVDFKAGGRGLCAVLVTCREDEFPVFRAIS